MTVTRRTVLGGMGLAALAAAMPGGAALAQNRTIRHYWWGNPERDKRTFAVIEAFQKKHPGITVSGETIGWGDYWTKMATQTAGRNMADLVQMDHRFLFEYVGRGALQPLDDHIGKTLMLDGFDQGPLDGGKVDGKLYALNIGSNSQMVVFNARVFKDARVEFDPYSWTHEDFARIAAEITKASGGRVKGTDDFSTYIEYLEAWVRQRGREFYDNDGNVAATAEDAASFFLYWDDLRKADAVAPRDRALMLDPALAERGVVKGDTAMSLIWSNQIVGVQDLMQDEAGPAMLPHLAGGQPGQFIKPSMFLSLSRDAKDVDAAMAYMNDWVNDPEITGILGLERGIPCSPKVREALAPSFSSIEKRTVDYFTAIQDKVGPLPMPQPKGAGEVRDAFMRTASNVILGTQTPADAGAEFIDDAQSIIERAR
ncbi:ABC transporter substrate-binding protein [Pannonibacter indicus]|uniref:ABC transporter substrate-binding protein n=1 Tax=Pannonibacter indicus TaxID=466044 RepID=UPI0035AEB75B